MHRMGVEERRARLGRRHRLAPSTRARTPEDVARSLVALHSTDAPTVYLAAMVRMLRGSLSDVEHALYDQRSVIRVMGMRRTVFVVPSELAPVVQAASGRLVAARERRNLLALLVKEGVTQKPEPWLKEVERVLIATLERLGEATATELAATDPRLATSIVLNRGRATEGSLKVCSRVLTILGAEGTIVRTRPLGSWRSSQYRWAMMNTWSPHSAHWSTEQAEVELARRWLAAFGPATVEDLQWWTGWTLGTVRRTLSEIGPAEVDLDGVAGIVGADDLEPVQPVEPWAALLPTLDSTPMGWKHREWYLGPHAPHLFDGTGNIGPSVWVDGRIVGGWGQSKDGPIGIKLLEDVGSDAQAAIEKAADALSAYIGAARLPPRARTLSLIERQILG